jgi:hypothetical protein
VDVYKITNNSSSIVDTNLSLIIQGLANGVRLVNASGITQSGDPKLVVFLPSGDLTPGPKGGDPFISVILPNGGVLQPGQSITEKLVFAGARNDSNLTYSVNFLSGQGKL